MKDIIIFTESFPYGYGEYSFIKEELTQLAMGKNKVTIVSDGKEKLICADFLKKYNIECYCIDRCLNSARYILMSLSSQLFWRDVAYILRDGKHIIKRVIRSFNMLNSAIRYSEWMSRNLVNVMDSILYTYWYYDMTLALCMLKKDDPKFSFITRTHGYDLKHERATGMRQPYKWFMDKYLDKIFFISDEGKNYYLNNYKVFDNSRYEVAYIGAPASIGNNWRKRKRDCNQYHVITCSSICGVKRLNYLIDALAICSDYKIKWSHIGDGCDEKIIKEYALDKLNSNQNVEYEFLGFMNREVIFDYYDRIGGDCFINVSESEGVPVAIMEAMAYGMPIIATNVGGNFETIRDNGILLSPNPMPDEILRAIVQICSASDTEYERLSANSLKLWEEKFDVVQNAKMFVKKLETL